MFPVRFPPLAFEYLLSTSRSSRVAEPVDHRTLKQASASHSSPRTKMMGRVWLFVGSEGVQSCACISWQCHAGSHPRRWNNAASVRGPKFDLFARPDLINMQLSEQRAEADQVFVKA